MANDKRCRVCGDELECLDYAGGSVWSCGLHGVRAWQFGTEGAQWSFGRAGRGPPLPAAAPPSYTTRSATTLRGPRSRLEKA